MATPAHQAAMNPPGARPGRQTGSPQQAAPSRELTHLVLISSCGEQLLRQNCGTFWRLVNEIEVAVLLSLQDRQGGRSGHRHKGPGHFAKRARRAAAWLRPASYDGHPLFRGLARRSFSEGGPARLKSAR